ncbi:PepSY domain-containing protein [Erythrobacter neustonensis]|uniref:PepSY domain-containing protein n=1 Tax=Erythrobacter neustonensis TaxID=1112 RepID=A0A192D468_9SPHN|nr:PepSY domain-containing protein [Erythrobacter neustonensis]ANK12816.1 hypothetical protein A9D12_07505 [Erythrobacter neustonensis]
MSMKTKTARWSYSKHQWLGLIGGVSLLVWGLSGLTHIAMVLFGPQQAAFMPPAATVALEGARPIAQTLAEQGIAGAVAVKTVPAPGGGVLWQVTAAADGARRYFRPADGSEVTGGDRAQAEFLARHYLATDRPITAARLQTKFDADYPWVNRLLPVWKLEFAGDDGLTAYVHTETSSLAGVNNTTKTRLPSMFRALHTWEWVPPGMDRLRVVVIPLMVGSLLALGLTGAAMLVTVRRKKQLPGARGWHRMAGYALALPLIMFSASGIYHLIQSALAPPVSQLKMGKPVNVASGKWPVEADWALIAKGRDIASVALVEGAEGQPFYRVGLAPKGPMGGGEHDHTPAKTAAADHGMAGHDHAAMMAAQAKAPTTDAEIREARFAGIKLDGPAIYLDAATGNVVNSGDKDLALAIARRFTGAPDSTVTGGAARHPLQPRIRLPQQAPAGLAGRLRRAGQGQPVRRYRHGRAGRPGSGRGEARTPRVQLHPQVELPVPRRTPRAERDRGRVRHSPHRLHGGVGPGNGSAPSPSGAASGPEAGRGRWHNVSKTEWSPTILIMVSSAPRRQRGAGQSYLGVFGECQRVFDVDS